MRVKNCTISHWHMKAMKNNGIDITTVKHAQSTTFYKTTTRLRRPMLSPPKQILIQSLRPPV